MHFPHRRLHQPKAGLHSRNSNFRLWLQTSEVSDSWSGSNIHKLLASATKWFGQLKIEKHCLICTFVLLHQHRCGVTKWCVWWIDSGTCAKMLEKPWSTQKGAWASKRFFPGGGQMHFSRGGPTVVKFHFTNSKLRD